MNLFWETRQLAISAEDHLTCFIAAALEIDAGFRAAYESIVLAPIGIGAETPRIAQVTIQEWYPEHRSQPDMMLVLDDGRRIACEHKLEAAETVQQTEEGQTLFQLQRYLELPDVAAVAYFRRSLKPPADNVLNHPRYLRPEAAAHFLWRDLYPALQAGEQPISNWLREGFERLGFTPVVPHVGDLWPNDDEVVQENQRNFGKLWNSTWARFADSFKIELATRCELYMTAKEPGLVTMVWVDPHATRGSLLRIRAYTDEAGRGEVRHRMQDVMSSLPVLPSLSESLRPNGQWGIDLTVPLHLLLGDVHEAHDQEARLFAQVVPVVEALLAAAPEV